MEDEKYELSFTERALIACLMEPILTWKDKNSIDLLWEKYTAGDKGANLDDNDEELKEIMVKILFDLRKKLGFD